MKKLFVLKFKKFTTEALIVYAELVVFNLLNNKNFPTLQSSVLLVKSEVNLYQNLYNIAKEGNATQRKTKNAQRIV